MKKLKTRLQIVDLDGSVLETHSFDKFILIPSELPGDLKVLEIYEIPDMKLVKEIRMDRTEAKKFLDVLNCAWTIRLINYKNLNKYSIYTSKGVNYGS